VQSKSKTIDDYLDEVPEDRREPLSRIRQLCLDILAGYEESMDYGMPCYKVPDGEVEIAFASQKNYISFYVLKEDVLNNYRESLSGLSVGKGCVRYKNPDKIDFKIVEQLLTESHQSDSPIC
jgi:uncharacterized protein YdhG (YjbR/CyaY superfamily)